MVESADHLPENTAALKAALIETRAKLVGGRGDVGNTLYEPDVFLRLASGEAQADVARSFNVSQATISRLAPGPFEVSVVGA